MPQSRQVCIAQPTLYFTLALPTTLVYYEIREILLVKYLVGVSRLFSLSGRKYFSAKLILRRV